MALFDTLTNLLPAAGTVLGGPVGGAVGTIAAGALQGNQANKLMDKMWAQDNQIPLYDPMQQAALQKVRQQEKQFRAGTDPNSALANRMVGQAAAQTQANLMRGGGPGLVQNLLTSQRTAGNQYAQIGANAAAAANQMLPMELGLVGDMAKRAYDRQRYRRDIYFAQAEQRRQDANNNMMAGIGLLPELNTMGVLKTGIRPWPAQWAHLHLSGFRPTIGSAIWPPSPHTTTASGMLRPRLKPTSD